MIADLAMTAERGAVCEHHMISDAAIMSDMGVGHVQSVVADLGHATAGLRAEIHGHALPKIAIGADDKSRRLPAIGQRLRRTAKRRVRMDDGAGSDRGMPGDVDMGDQAAAARDRDVRTDHAERPDLRVIGDPRCRVDRRPADECAPCRVFYLSLIMAQISASQTILPSTLASPRNHHMVLRCRSLRHVVFDAIAGDDRAAKLCAVDGQEIHLRRPVVTHRQRTNRARRLRHSLDQEHAGHQRPAGKMSLKERLIEADVLQPDARLVAADALDAIDQEKWIAMRQQVQNLLRIERGRRRLRRLVHGHSSPAGSDCSARLALRRPFAICSSIFISRNQSLTGLAGVPPHRAPGGTSSLTMLIAAICAPSPMVT